jgi:urease accessory protein UreH
MKETHMDKRRNWESNSGTKLNGKVMERNKMALQKDTQKILRYKWMYGRVLRHEKFAFRCFHKIANIYKSETLLLVFEALF